MTGLEITHAASLKSKKPPFTLLPLPTTQTGDTVTQLALPVTPTPVLYSNPGEMASSFAGRGRGKERKGVCRQGGETEKETITPHLGFLGSSSCILSDIFGLLLT